MKLRVPLAALVLLLGVGGLLAAWYVSSVRALEAEVRLRVQRGEVEVADRLARRLEELRAGESQRPWFHYQNLYHDPKGASQGLSVVPSPLANEVLWDVARITLPGAAEVAMPRSTAERTARPPWIGSWYSGK